MGWLRDLLGIFTWKEFWLILSVPSMITGIWILFSFLLSIRNDVIRTVTIWSLIFLLMFAAAVTDAMQKQSR